MEHPHVHVRAPRVPAAVRKGASVAIGLLCMLYGGTIYLFGTYMAAMGVQLGYRQQELSLIATLGQSAAYLAQWGFGYVVDKRGHIPAMLAALVIQPLAYGLVSAMLAGRLATTNYGLMTFFYVLVGIGGAPAYSAPLAVNIRNFSDSSRGLIVGVHVALFGLSTLVFSQIYVHAFVTNGAASAQLAQFIEMIAISGAGVFFLSLFLLHDSADFIHAHFTNLAVNHDSPAARNIRRESLIVSPPDVSHADLKKDAVLARHEPQHSKHDYNGLALARQPDYWLLFLVLFMSASSGLMYINNLSAVIKSLATQAGSYTAEDISVLISTHASVLSASNFAGRLIMGVVSDWYLRDFHLSRRAFLIGVSSLMTIAQIVALTTSDVQQLYAVTVLVGVAYGSTFCLIPTLVGDLFGTRSFGSNWGSMLLAPAVAGPITNLIFGYIYDSHSPGDGTLCAGNGCYRQAFIITVAMCAFAVALAIVFTVRHRVWRSLHHELPPAKYHSTKIDLSALPAAVPPTDPALASATAHP